MKCYACGHEGDDFLNIRQIGVNNYLITGEVKEPEIYLKIMICPVCGNLQVDLSSIKTKVIRGLWDKESEDSHE